MFFKDWLRLVEFAATAPSDFSLLQGTQAAKLANPNFYFQLRRFAKSRSTMNPGEVGGPEFCKQISEFIAKATGADMHGGTAQADQGYQYGHAFNSITNGTGQSILIDGSHEQEIWNSDLGQLEVKY